MKLPGKSSGKQVIGVMVDGTDMRIAQLGWENGEIAIYAMETVVLPSRLGKIASKNIQHTAAVAEEAGDIFGFTEDEEEVDEPIMESSEQQDEDISSTMINVFAKYPLSSNKIAVNIPEGQASYYNFESNFGLKGKKLGKRIRDEVGPLVGGSLDTATIDHFTSDSGNMIVVVSEGNIPIIEELIDVKNYLAGGVPYFCQVTSNEIALVNLIRNTMDLGEDQNTALVYIGADFSRIIILKGEEPISFIQAIREGYQSPQVCQTIFSKILLEQEEAGIPDINHIVLCGEIGIPRAEEFFKKQFPEAEVKAISPGPLDTSMLKSEEVAIFANFAIPVALAWEALDKKSHKWIRLDLMPHAIKDSQKAFKIAWHGIALLAVIFMGMFLLSYQGFNRLGHIKSLEESIRLKQTTIASLEADLIYISQLQNQITMNRENLEFLNGLIGDTDKWSRLFEKLSTDFETVKRIWIEQIQSTPDGFTLIGKGLSRDRIPKLAGGFEGVELKRVTRVISESGEIAYEFEFDAEMPPPPPEINSQQTITSDHAGLSGGSIEGEPAISMEPVTQVKEEKPEPVEEQPAVAAQEKTDKPAPVNREIPARNEEKLTVLGPVQQNPAKTVDPPPKTADSESKPVVKKENKEPSTTPKAHKPVTPQSPSAAESYQKGVNSIRDRDVSGALAEFEALVRNHPSAKETGAAYYWIGECHYSMKNFTSAVTAFTKSLEFKNNSKRAAGMVMLGMSHLKLDNKTEARRQFESLLEAYPESEFAETAKRKLAALGG